MGWSRAPWEPRKAIEFSLYQKCTDPVYPDTPWTPDTHSRGPALCPLSCSSSYPKGSPAGPSAFSSPRCPCALFQLPGRGRDHTTLSPGSLQHLLLPCSIGARPFSEKPLSSVPGQGGFQGRAQEDRPPLHPAFSDQLPNLQPWTDAQRSRETRALPTAACEVGSIT